MKRFAVLVLALLMLSASVAFAAPSNAVFEMQDFGLWGSEHPEWFNVGWKYQDSFDTNTITGIEVGLKDADGKLIVKYTAGATQLDFQKANGYITATKQSSAPFYKTVPEVEDLDWSVTHGPAFANFCPATCYVTVKVGNNSYTLTNVSSHTHTFVDHVCTLCGGIETVKYVAPRTGDNSQLALWSILMVAAAAGMVIMHKKRVNA